MSSGSPLRARKSGKEKENGKESGGGNEGRGERGKNGKWKMENKSFCIVTRLGW